MICLDGSRKARQAFSIMRASNRHEAALESECSVRGVGHSSHTLPPEGEFVDADNGECINGRFSPATIKVIREDCARAP